MKKLLTLLALSLIVASCGKKTTTPSSPEETSSNPQVATSSSDAPASGDRMSKEYLVARVNAIYQNVFQKYYGEDSDLNEQDAPSPEEIFCTKDWNELFDKVMEYDNIHNPDDVGFSDADYWIMGQDFQNLSISDVNVISMDEDDATVELILHNCGELTHVRLELDFERGDWFIDNFIDLDNDYNWGKEMKDYMK